MRQVRLRDLAVAVVRGMRFRAGLSHAILGSVTVHERQVCRRHVNALYAVISRRAGVDDFVKLCGALLGERGGGRQCNGDGGNKGQFFSSVILSMDNKSRFLVAVTLCVRTCTNNKRTKIK